MDRNQARLWRTPSGEPVGCAEKRKVLNQNLEELRAIVLEALDDAALMGCDVEQVRAAIHEAVDAVSPSYPLPPRQPK